MATDTVKNNLTELRNDDDDDDDDESKSYVRPLLQLETVTSVLMIHSGKQFSFQITTERGWMPVNHYCGNFFRC